MISVDKFARRLLRELNNWTVDGLVLYALVEEQIIEHGVLTQGDLDTGVLPDKLQLETVKFAVDLLHRLQAKGPDRGDVRVTFESVVKLTVELGVLSQEEVDSLGLVY